MEGRVGVVVANVMQAVRVPRVEGHVAARCEENFDRMLRDDEASSEPQVWDPVTGDEVVRVGAGDSEEPCGFLDRRGDQGWAHAPCERSPALTSTPRGTA